jgi:tight adherence protein B
VCSSAGSGLAAGIDRLQEGLRAAESQRRAVDAELAGPRATAGLLAVLPVAGLGLAAALGAHPVQVLLHTRFGLYCLLLGLGLDAAGVMWTRRLVASADVA